MVKWGRTTHEILAYNDNNGYGLTRCRKGIGPWDIWLVGRVTCKGCKKSYKRDEREAKHSKEKGPREWFPKK